MTINKEITEKLSSLKSGKLAKNFIVNGKGLKEVNQGAEFTAHPQLSDNTNVQMHTSNTLATGDTKGVSMDWANAQLRNAEGLDKMAARSVAVTR